MTAHTRFPGEPQPTFTDWRREAVNAKRKAPRWHLVAEGRRTYSRTMASQIRLGRIAALQPQGAWEARYQATDQPGHFTLYIRFTGADSAS